MTSKPGPDAEKCQTTDEIMLLIIQRLTAEPYFCRSCAATVYHNPAYGQPAFIECPNCRYCLGQPGNLADRVAG